jgi:hypothetical protein
MGQEIKMASRFQKNKKIYLARHESKKIVFVLAICFLFIFKAVLAVNLGISPASVDFPNVLRGGYSERWIVISADSDRPILAEVDTLGDIKEWINFSVQVFNVSKGNPYYLKVSVIPPLDTPNGNYTGFLRVKTGDMGSGVEDHFVGIVKSTLNLKISLIVTDIESLECSVSSLSVDSAEQGDDILFHADISNNGNVKLRPNVNIGLWDQEQISKVGNFEFHLDEILPTTKANFTLRVKSSGLEIGQYWAEFLSRECYFSQTLTFDILKEGALKASGILSGIATKKSAQLGETVLLLAKFKNTGEKEIDAQFKGQISKDGKIVQILDSEKVNVGILRTNDFSFYFTPGKTGKYVISGRVYYSGKKTFESSTTIDIFSKKFKFSSLILPLVYLFLALLIFYMGFKIRKERKAYSEKLRRIKHGI